MLSLHNSNPFLGECYYYDLSPHLRVRIRFMDTFARPTSYDVIQRIVQPSTTNLNTAFTRHIDWTPPVQVGNHGHFPITDRYITNRNRMIQSTNADFSDDDDYDDDDDDVSDFYDDDDDYGEEEEEDVDEQTQPCPVKPDISNELCSICLEKLTNDCPRAHPCHHVFHQECITRWTKEKRKCPYCRTTVKRLCE